MTRDELLDAVQSAREDVDAALAALAATTEGTPEWEAARYDAGYYELYYGFTQLELERFDRKVTA